MTRLFALAIFLSATLLFMVQPIFGKTLLPILGGSPAVWSTCLAFFQAVLLLGYLYAHGLTTRVAPRWQWLVHAVVLVIASVLLPLPIDIGEPEGAVPRTWLLGALASTVGLPFLALSATAPLLQRWFSETSDRSAQDPYFLYAASNAGSLLGLLGYLLVEPIATRSAQANSWSFAFWAVAAIITACGYASIRHRMTRTGSQRPARPIPLRERLLWVALALVPSALLLGVTQHLATDVVSAPLLWVVPMVLYLTTYIVAFSTRKVGQARVWGRVAPIAVLIVLVLSLADVRYPLVLVAIAHLAAFTALTMVCHVRLAESRPAPAHLTAYFVSISLGGALGGVAVALIAPALFSSILEYPLAIAAALLLRPQISQAAGAAKSAPARRVSWTGAALLFVAGYLGVAAYNSSEHAAQAEEMTQSLLRTSLAIPVVLLLLIRRRALLFAGAVGGLLVGASVVRTGGDVLHRERTFFGVHQVTSTQGSDWHVLTHGTTTHGVQATRGKVRLLPSAYYHPSGPVGDVVFTLSADGRFRDVGVVGLGAGALAGYAGNGVRMDFFEVDEAVIRIAENPAYFTYLADARARAGVTLRTMAIDGRLGLRSMPEASYDLIVVDAFSSDAIPTHLITREAVAMFTSRLKSRGVLAFHVSNRFFDLGPVLARIAEDQRLVAFRRNDQDVPRERAEEAMRPSVWIVLARANEDVGQIAHAAPRWVRLSDADGPLWTDDYSNVLGALQD